METALISVIVPVYNVAQYLEKSIASIQKQTYQNLEIILVDDGATDESGRLCDAIAEQDDRVSVLHKKNSSNRGALLQYGHLLVAVRQPQVVIH